MDDRSRGGHGSRIKQALDDAASPANSALAASWRRSMSLHGLDPEDAGGPQTLTETQLHQARQAMEPMTRAAQGVLDRLFLAIGDAGCCVLLTNADGVPVERRGAAADDALFRRWGLWPGAIWSEAVEGTNGIGTALVEHRPLTIHGGQHFHTRNTALSCISHPIHDPRGRLAGLLDVSSCRADATVGMLGLIAAAVADAARAIEAQSFRQAFATARIVLAGDAAERNAAALLAVDRDDLVIGATRAARLALAITDERIAGQLAASEVLSPGSVDADLLEAERGAVRRALALSGGNVSAAARALGISRATLHRKLHRLGLASEPH
ncbi:GAF domain-containing protein [Caulobacter sp. BK020]|uniref:GAF domain-containing protein n=1 Tax=Caulobacter sp. BK020 TaxID=2512117 RepID=UPI00104EC240|nr:GAF domain-containing protein [Caulobacter sp. BK020]TCS03941.1 GAF domain-containing protein [Caulobacter sp. BK020]